MGSRRSDMSRMARGRWGESVAASHYRRLGFDVVARQWRSPDADIRGDLDLVVWRPSPAPGLIVFCEVKARRDASGFGGAAAAVGEAKQNRVRLLAQSWLGCHETADADIRFDVAAIDGVVLTVHEAAF